MDNNTKIIYKKSASQTIFILLLISMFCFYTYYVYTTHQQEIAKLKYDCTPISENDKEEKKLDINSSIVKSLYNIVLTNIREDLALSGTMDDDYKLYLAFKKIPNSKFYDSNCNLFSNTSMVSYTCVENEEQLPKAFKIESLHLAYSELFGDDSSLVDRNIQIGNSCIGGYQYIEKRGEYVEGQCENTYTTTFRVDKNLTKAYAKDGRIYLVEDVRYYGNEGLDLPNNLKSGKYIYTFKLDMNYNYILENKQIEQ